MKQIRFFEVVRNKLDGLDDIEVLARFATESYADAQSFAKDRGNDSGTKDAEIRECDYSLFENLQEVEDARQQTIRDNALSKLTPEERSILGV